MFENHFYIFFNSHPTSRYLGNIVRLMSMESHPGRDIRQIRAVSLTFTSCLAGAGAAAAEEEGSSTERNHPNGYIVYTICIQ